MTSVALAKKLYNSIRNLPAVAIAPGFTFAELVADRPFVTPVELWQSNARLVRALRASGLPESEILGNASDFEKLVAWLGALRGTVGSTLAADIFSDLSALGVEDKNMLKNAPVAWRMVCETLARGGVTPRTLLSGKAALIKVEVTEPTPVGPLGETAYPLLCLDAIFSIENADFAQRVAAISQKTGISVVDLPTFEKALSALLHSCAKIGAPAVMLDLSGFDRFERPDPYHAGLSFARGLAGEGDAMSPREIAIFRAQLLRTLGLIMKEIGMRFLLRVRPKTEHVKGDFSVKAFEKLLSYLQERRALVPTVLSLSAGEIPRGLALLLGRFRNADGTPLLLFGIEGEGATSAELSRSLRFYLKHGAASLLLGLTDSDQGCFSAPTRSRFVAALSGELARYARADGAGLFEAEDLLAVGRAIYQTQAAQFFGV